MVSGRRVLSTVSILALSSELGILGGGFLGAIILPLRVLTDRFRASGMGSETSWTAQVWIGLLLGGEFGALATPIAYITLIHKIGLRKAWLPAAMGTLIGGFVGALVGPMYAALVGIAGFFIAIKRAVEKSANQEGSKQSHL